MNNNNKSPWRAQGIQLRTYSNIMEQKTENNCKEKMAREMTLAETLGDGEEQRSGDC